MIDEMTVIMFESLSDSFMCRLCGWEDKENQKMDQIEISLVTFKSTIVVVKAKDLIESNLNLKLEDDQSLPSRMCSDCKLGLQALSEFLIRVRQGQSYLRKVIQTDMGGNSEKLRYQDPTCIVEQENLPLPKPKRGRPKKGAVKTNTVAETRTSSSAVLASSKEADSSEIQFDQFPDTKDFNDSTSLESRSVLIVSDSEVSRLKSPAVLVGKSASLSVQQSTQEEMAFVEKGIKYPYNMPREFDLEEDTLNIDESHDETCKNENLDLKLIDNEVYKCDSCSSVFIDKDDLSRHTKNNHQIFSCQHCQTILIGEASLKEHQNNLHSKFCDSEQSVVPEKDENVVKNDESSVSFVRKPESLNFGCGFCLMTFLTESEKIEHVRKIHGRNVYCCGSCDRKFTSASSLHYHTKATHQKQGLTCSFEGCSKTFSMKSLLKRHLKLHQEVKPYNCSKCTKTFKSLSNLRQHEKCHSVVKMYQCELCGREFKHKCSLNLHKQTHTGDKRFSCTQCHKKFYQSGNLTEHMRVHTGERKFSCEICPKSFKMSSQFTRHQKWHSEQQNRIPDKQRRQQDINSCGVCDQMFESKKYLLDHMDREHQNDFGHNEEDVDSPESVDRIHSAGKTKEDRSSDIFLEGGTETRTLNLLDGIKGHEIPLADKNKNHGIALVGAAGGSCKFDDKTADVGGTEAGRFQVWNIIKSVVEQDDEISKCDDIDEEDHVIYIKYENTSHMQTNQSNRKDGSDIDPLSFAAEYLKDLHNIPVTQTN